MILFPRLDNWIVTEIILAKRSDLVSRFNLGLFVFEQVIKCTGLCRLF